MRIYTINWTEPEKILQGTFNLSKTTNDQNQPVIIIQPVLPID
jgi:hypothetical protein